MTTYKDILFDLTDGIARLTFNKPPLNILDLNMMNEIAEAVKTASRDKNLKLLVLSANGKAFCAGVSVEDHMGDQVDQMMEVFHRIFTVLGQVEAPTLAVVQGACLGGGLEVAAYCDMILAAEGAKLGQPEIKVGVFPPVAAALFPKIMSPKKAYELVLAGDNITAKEAEALGLVNKVVPDDQLALEAEKFIQRFRSLSAPVLQLTKKALKESLERNFFSALREAELIYLRDLMTLEDAQEGLKAFLEKRKPIWKNR